METELPRTDVAPIEAVTEYNGFLVERNVPMRSYEAKYKNYPLHLMDVGDSFFIPTPIPPKISFIHTVRYYASANRMKFSIRKVDGGLRCWRIL